jgi:uncharacterized protein YbaA (DUF1428 family)
MAKKSNGTYVDGFVFVVPKKKVAAYKKMAKEGAAAWKKFGALDYKECMGEEMKIKAQKGMPAPLSFLKLTSAKPTDTVWFSFITFKNKAHRNEVNKKVMDYLGTKYADMKDFEMPVNTEDMAYGGFSVQVD